MLATLNLQLALPEWPEDIVTGTAAQLATGESDFELGFSQQLRLRIDAAEPLPSGGGVLLPQGGSELPVLPTEVLDARLLRIGASQGSVENGQVAEPMDIDGRTPELTAMPEFTALPEYTAVSEFTASSALAPLSLPRTAIGQADIAAPPLGIRGISSVNTITTHTLRHELAVAVLPQDFAVSGADRPIVATQAKDLPEVLRVLNAGTDAVPATSAQASSRDGTVVHPPTATSNASTAKPVSAELPAGALAGRDTATVAAATIDPEAARGAAPKTSLTPEIPVTRAAIAARTDELLHADAVRAAPNPARSALPDRRPFELTQAGQSLAINAAKAAEYPPSDAVQRPGILAELQLQRSVEGLKDLRQPRIVPQVLQSLSAPTDAELRDPLIGTTGIAGASDDSSYKAAAQKALDLITTPVKDPAWGDRLNERVLLMAGNRQTTAEIRLTPAELGPLRVTVSVDDGSAHLTFHAQHAMTREAIEQALPRLREMLAENGISLGQADVGEQGVAHGGDAERDGDGPAGNELNDVAPESRADSSERQARRTVPTDGGVDTFA